MNKNMIEFSSSLKLNEIHVVDSPFNEDPKNIIFFQGGPNFGRGMVGKFRENGAIARTSIIMQIESGQFLKRISATTPWYQNPCDASIFLHARTKF